MSRYLGIDAGSVSLKLVLWDGNEVLWSNYTRVLGVLFSTLEDELIRLQNDLGNIGFDGVVVVGSGRALIGKALNVKTTDEISAQVASAKKIHPDVKTIIEIGGQDAKAISIKSDGTVNFLMNDLCAAGTGAFLDQQATRLGLKVEDLSNIASKSVSPLSIASRCAVFAKSDMTHHQQAGKSLSDIVAGLHLALAKGFIANVSRGMKLESKVCFHGGVAANKDLVSRFECLLGDKVIVPENYKVTGAHGAAIIAEQEKNPVSMSDLIERIKKYSVVDDDNAGSIKGKCREVIAKWPKISGTYFGIDVGSVSVKFVAIGKNGLLYKDYRYSNGDPKSTLDKMLATASSKLNINPDAVGVTGSGRAFASWLVGADVVPNEISAQNRALDVVCPEAETIVEIGGQDAKFIRRKNGKLIEFKMNRSCAAGTGAFLTEQVPRLKFKDEADLSSFALNAKKAPMLGARCAVFMESDLVSHQQRGWNREALAASLARSVIVNYLEKVVGKEISDDKILFLGGVAENQAVAKSLSEELNSEIMISKLGKYSAAIGSALMSFDAKTDKKSMFSWKTATNVSSKRCDGCGHECLVWNSGEKNFGGRCGKYEQEVKRSSSELIEQRKGLLELSENSSSQFTTHDSQFTKTIGIPRALLFYDRFPLWKTFFEEIGMEVIVSPDKLHDSLPALPADTCLPVKMLMADTKRLDREKYDYLFVPSYVADKHKSVHCPLVLAAPMFAKYGLETKVLDPAIKWDDDPESEKNAFVDVAYRLEIKKEKAEKAWGKAKVAQKNFEKNVYEYGKSQLEKIEDPAFVLIGKDYNISDKRLNSNAVSILSSYLPVFTQDMIVESPPVYDKEYKQLVWYHGCEMVMVAKKIAQNDKLLPIILTSFGCGPDSFTLRYIREILKDKPFLVLEVDEHTSEVGIATRIEAFLDSLDIKKKLKKSSAIEKINETKKWKRIYLANVSPHTLAFASAVKSAGLEPVILPPSDQKSYDLAKRYIDGNECHPYVLLLGDYLKAAKTARDGDCFFLPPATSCRLGHFSKHMSMISKELKFNLGASNDIDILSPKKSIIKVVGRPKASIECAKVLRGCDLLLQRYYEIRLGSENKLAVKKSFESAQEIVKQAIYKDKNILESFKTATNVLEDCKFNKAKAVKIGITGDYFTRVCDFANNNVLDEISDRGFDLLLSPTFTDVLTFDSYKFFSAGVKHRNFKKSVTGAMMRLVIPRLNRRLSEIIKCDYPMPLDYKQAVKDLEGFVPMPVHSSVLGTMAAITEQVRAGAKGIVNIITFNCTFGVVISAFLRRLAEEKGIPSVTLIYEGLKPTHNMTRLEAFLNQLK